MLGFEFQLSQSTLVIFVLGCMFIFSPLLLKDKIPEEFWEEVIEQPIVKSSTELLEEGVLLYDNGNFVKASEILEKAALQGNAEAQYHLGEMYYHGEGVLPNDSMAFYWLKISAENSLPKGQSHLGQLYLQGTKTVKRDTLLAKVSKVICVASELTTPFQW